MHSPTDSSTSSRSDDSPIVISPAASPTASPPEKAPLTTSSTTTTTTTTNKTPTATTTKRPSSPPPKVSNTDVLIIGAGPTGLTLALELSVQSIPFRIIDKLPEPSDKSRALAVQCRSQELLNRHPHIAESMLADGTKGPGVNIYCNKRHLVTGTFDDLGFDDTRFPLPLWVSQADTEAAMLRQLEVYGGTVERGVSAEDIKQDGVRASATLVRSSSSSSSSSTPEKEILRAKYIVGCDGAHSVVRHSADVTFEGSQYPQQYILCDAKVRGDYDAERVSLFLGSRVMVVFPLRDGVIRMVGERSSRSKREGDPDVAEIEAFMEEVMGRRPEIEEALWLASFRWNCRGVNRYRDGRLFLAGDAAHIHSPAGGQGMNTGIQDAVNLGWKLAAVIRGEKEESFLDTYHEERHPVGQHLLTGTDRMFSMVASQNTIFTTVRNALMPWIVPRVWNNRARRLSVYTFISQMAIKYRRSSIVGTAIGFEGPVRGGWRAPDGQLTDERGEKARWLLGMTSARDHTILLFAGVEADEENLEAAEEKLVTDGRFKEYEVVKVYAGDTVGKGGYKDVDGMLHKRYGFEKGAGFVVVRPDGYVEFIGPAECVEEFLMM
ncbi:FAD binding domain-containing protein [Colletotrichum higginsianum IMI 349063]|uniref:FAD binding domain-containing protein n=1 Tax=Colletotrichum higginsianum (strain IMI 349063) TaxID=759273 RepID=A0A1B7Y150_COLHI|nr:FAD binding domain-containing protein [Colletotrichum higginsianum IMI 349063]OBR05737.1 FAD binding domain-containing protein [Colletotrichum higginsianum IMI 349063]